MPPQRPETPEVTVYTSPGCGPCVALKAWLNARGVPFTPVDLATDPDPDAAAQLRAAGHSSTPVMSVAGTLVAGFRPDRLAELLGLDRCGDHSEHGERGAA